MTTYVNINITIEDKMFVPHINQFKLFVGM